MTSYDMRKIYLLTEGSTQRRVAVRVGMLARNVINMVRKKETRNTGRNMQSDLQVPGIAAMMEEVVVASPRSVSTGMQVQLRKSPSCPGCLS